VKGDMGMSGGPQVVNEIELFRSMLDVDVEELRVVLDGDRWQSDFRGRPYWSISDQVSAERYFEEPGSEAVTDVELEYDDLSEEEFLEEYESVVEKLEEVYGGDASLLYDDVEELDY